jgi:hypothetical protein
MEGKLMLQILTAADGSIVVQGQLQDKIQCLGLLELAKVLVLKHQPKQELVVPVAAMPPGITLVGANG